MNLQRLLPDTAANTKILFSGRQDRLFMKFSILSWIKWTVIPENVFYLLLHEQEEEGLGLLTKHSLIVVGIKSYLPLILLEFWIYFKMLFIAASVSIEKTFKWTQI